MDAHLADFDRAGRITASVVAGILRHDDNMSRRKAWRIITGREPYQAPTPDMQRGLDHEEDAVASLEIDFGLFCQPGHFVKHCSIGWLGASPDAFLREPSGILVPVEAKCPRVLHTVIPDKYYDQVQTQLECCDAPYGYFISWTEEAQYVQKIERDAQWWQDSLPVLREFYERYVEPDICPPVSPRRQKNAGGRVVRCEMADSKSAGAGAPEA